MSILGNFPISGTKEVEDNLASHIGDTVKHVTAAERSAWNAKQSKLTGAEGQIVVFDAAGNASAANMPEAGGHVAQATAPENTKSLWVDTANGGVTKYYNGSAWVPTASVWG